MFSVFPTFHFTLNMAAMKAMKAMKIMKKAMKAKAAAPAAPAMKAMKKRVCEPAGALRPPSIRSRRAAISLRFHAAKDCCSDLLHLYARRSALAPAAGLIG